MVKFMRHYRLPVVSDIAIILSDVLEHVPEPRLTLQSLRKVLRPLVHVPDFAEKRLRNITLEIAKG
jgi:hypothetical protein